MNRPLTGVSVAVFRDDEVLLAQRGREPFAGFWSLPGGSQEWGETLEEAARRELLEETGLSAGALVFARFIEPMLRDADGQVLRHFVLAVFVCRSFSGQAVAGDDASAIAWTRVDALDDAAMTPGTAAIVRELAVD